MIRVKFSYQLIKSIYKSRVLVVFCLLFLIIAKPPLMASIHNIEIKYEWFESVNEGDSEKKDTISEFESEDQNVYNLCFINIGFDDYNTSSYFSFHKNFLDFNPNIQLPPPKA